MRHPTTAPKACPRADLVGPVWAGPGTEAVEVALAGGPPRRARRSSRSVQGLVTGVVDDPAGELARAVEGLATDPLGASGDLVGELVPPPPGAPAELVAPGVAPPILPPSAWGSPGWSYSTPTCENGPESAPLQRAIVHHTVTPNWYGPDEVPAMLRSIYYAHLARGYCDIAYNFVVDRFGRTWEARRPASTRHRRAREGLQHRLRRHRPARSAPPGGAPAGGGADKCPVPGATADLAAWKFRLAGIAPEIVGHRDVGATACPGDLLYGELDNLRAAVAARL